MGVKYACFCWNYFCFFLALVSFAFCIAFARFSFFFWRWLTQIFTSFKEKQHFFANAIRPSSASDSSFNPPLEGFFNNYNRDKAFAGLWFSTNPPRIHNLFLWIHQSLSTPWYQPKYVESAGHVTWNRDKRSNSPPLMSSDQMPRPRED